MTATVEPTTHDFFRVSYTYQPQNGGLEGYMFLFTTLEAPKQGDYILLRSAQSEDGRTRYQVKSVKWYSDPGDMYCLELVFAPRSR